jgi:hypothetical protein
MEFETDALFRQFIARVDRNTLTEKAERVLRDKASHVGAMSVFANSPGGLIGCTLRKLLIDSAATCSLSELDKLADRLIEFYDFPSDWVPPRLLIQEALALTVYRRKVIERLQRELGKSIDLASVFERAAATIQRVEDAFLLGDERTDVILEELRQVK